MPVATNTDEKMDTFSEAVQTLLEHISDLRQQVMEQPAAPQTLLQVAFETVNTTLEELRVAEEEMRAQNEMLADAQETTQEWRLHYQDLFNSAPDAYLVTDLLGVIAEANLSAQNLLGLSLRFLVGKPLAGFVPAGNRQDFRNLLLGMVSDSSGREYDGREHEITLQPRKQAPVAVSATVTVIQAVGGRPTGLRWLIRDVTARGAAEADRYRRIVEEVTDYAICLLDADGGIMSWNSGAVRIFGYTPEESLGMPVAALFTAEDRAAGLPEQEQETARTEGRTKSEGWLVRKDGNRLWASCVLTTLRDPSGEARWFAKVMRDETVYKEEQQRMAEAYAHEQRIAATFQRALLPEIPSRAFPGLELTTRYAAASQEALVGGDFFDAFRLDADQVALVVGDVSGKGLAAAARTAEIKYALRAYLRETPEPGAALANLSAFLHDNQRLGDETEESGGSVFVTLAVVVVHSGTGEAWAAAAGAEPPLLLSASGQAAAIPALGPLPGMTREASYPSAAFTLGVGDTLVLVTDGITEARSGSDFLDYDGFTRLAQGTASASLSDLGEAILSGARAFAQGNLHDDVCLLLARRV